MLFLFKKAPKQYLSELKNIYQDGLKEIVIEDPILYEETIAYLKMYQPEDLGKVHRYEDTLLPLDKLHNIERKAGRRTKRTRVVKVGSLSCHTADGGIDCDRCKHREMYQQEKR